MTYLVSSISSIRSLSLIALIQAEIVDAACKSDGDGLKSMKKLILKC